MKISSLLFPREYRSFKGKRWTNIALRTIHLMGVAGLGGGFLYHAPATDWRPYLTLCLVSGFALMGLDIWTHGLWLIQLRGVAILIKILVLLCVPLLSGYEAHVLVAVIVISGIIAHAPGAVRYFSIFHGRRLEALSDLDSRGSRQSRD